MIQIGAQQKQQEKARHDFKQEKGIQTNKNDTSNPYYSEDREEQRSQECSHTAMCEKCLQ